MSGVTPERLQLIGTEEGTMDEDESGIDGQDQDETGGSTDGGGTTEKTFTQAQMTEIIQRRERKAQRDAVNGFLKELGLESPDALKGLLQAQKAREEAEKTDLQKAQEAAAAARREADQAKAEAREATLRAAFGEALRDQIPKDRVAAAMKLGLPTLLADGTESDEDRIEAALAAIKADVPDWFQPQDDQQGNGSTTNRTPPPPSRTNGQRQQAQGGGVLDRYSEWKKGAMPQRFDFSGRGGKA